MNSQTIQKQEKWLNYLQRKGMEEKKEILTSSAVIIALICCIKRSNQQKQQSVNKSTNQTGITCNNNPNLVGVAV